MSEINHEHTRCPVCPHCGREFKDIWGYVLEDKEKVAARCLWCGGKFTILVSGSVNYSTQAMKEKA